MSKPHYWDTLNEAIDLGLIPRDTIDEEIAHELGCECRWYDRDRDDVLEYIHMRECVHDYDYDSPLRVFRKYRDVFVLTNRS